MVKNYKMILFEAEKAILVTCVFCCMFALTLGVCSTDPEKISGLPAADYFTAWYNSDDPSDGTDTENFASVLVVDSSVCNAGTPIDVECRVRIAHLSTTEGGQTLSSSCTDHTSGLVCNNMDQPSGETCYDYEIRFLCPPPPGALPAPNLHWELNGRASETDKAPEDCSGRPKFFNSTIYSNIPGVPDGWVNPYHHSTLILQEGPSSSRHACALRSEETGQANLGTLLGYCIFEPKCCADGITVSVWMNDHSPIRSKRTIITSGGHEESIQGFAFQKRQTKQFAFPVNYHNGKNIGTLTDSKPDPLTPYGVWAHYIQVFKNRCQLYVNGKEVFDQAKFAGGGTASTLPLLLFAKEPDVNDLSVSPDVSLSNLKIFNKIFTADEALQLYEEEIGTLSVSSEDNIHILYVRQISDVSDPNLLVECLARGPKNYSEPSINWFILNADGINYSELNQPGLNYREYTESVSDNYRRKSVLQLINYNDNSTIVCEAVDVTTGGRKAFRMEQSERTYNWTAWISLDTPDYINQNDNESMAHLQRETCEHPLNIECRTKYTHISSDATGQVFDVDCSVDGGLVCVGSHQSSGDSFACFDYEVRLLCPQQPFYWTDWLNANDGSADDDETFSAHQALNNPTLCHSPLFAQCRVLGSNISWDSTGLDLKYPSVCSPSGLLCRGVDNGGACQDFEVRYACPYPNVVSPSEYWDLSGRLTVGGADPFDCSSHNNNNIYSNTGGSTGTSHSLSLQYTEAPPQLSQKCAAQSTNGPITLGNFDGECLSKIGWCPHGMTISMWIKQHNSAIASDMVFFTSGGDDSTSNGFAFKQLSSNKNYVAHFRSDGRYWNDIILPETDITIGEWFHITLTFDDATDGKIYINGELKDSTTDSTLERNSHDEKDDFIIGASHSDTYRADAAFSEVKFFDSVLTEEAVKGLYFCGETATDPEVLSCTQDSHHLNPDLTMSCQVKGYPLTGIKWFMTSNIDTSTEVVDLMTVPDAVFVTPARSACVLTATLIYNNFATTVRSENMTIIASGEFNQKKAFSTLLVDLPNECERAVGFEHGEIRSVQISSNVVYSGVPYLNGGPPWTSSLTDGSAYIDFDFGIRYKFAGLVVQGTDSSFIASYKVFYKDSPSVALTLHSTLNGGQNSVWQVFNPVIEARIIRIQSLDTDGSDEARVEFYGCPIEEPVLNLTKLSSSYNPTTNIYTLLCEGSYSPPPEVMWLADGQVISEPRYEAGQEVEGTLTFSKELEVKDFELSDEEVLFTCVVGVNGTNITQDIRTVYSFTGQISVENTTEIIYLQSVSFKCTATGDDVYTMEWYFTNTTPTTPILLGNGNGFSAGGFTAGDSPAVLTLDIQSYDEQHDGTYQCSVNRGTAHWNLTTKADILLIVTVAEPVYHQTNLSYTLTCRVVHYGGNPSSIEWILPNGTVVRESDTDGVYQVSQTPGETVDVSAMIVQGEYQLGTYTCNGLTAKDTWSETVVVAQGESFEITSLSGRYNFTHLSYTAECIASYVGSPPKVTWITPDGSRINETSGDCHVSETVSSSNLTNVLIISSTNFSKYDGNFTCKVSSGDLTVEFEDTILLRYAYDGALTLNVTERFELGDDVKLTCSASEGDRVDDFSWSRLVDGSTPIPVVQDDILKLSHVTGESSRTSYLEIAMFSRIDEGIYECSVNGGSKKLRISISALPGNCIFLYT